MQPVHHRLRPPPAASGDFSGAMALTNLMRGEEAFAAADMRRTQGQVAQISRCLAPVLVINL